LGFRKIFGWEKSAGGGMSDIPRQDYDAFGRPIYQIDYPVLAQFWMSQAKVQVIRGPVGSAKSKTCNIKLLKIASEQRQDRGGIRRTRWGVIRNTYPELTTTTMRTWRDTFPENVYGRIIMSKPAFQRLRFDDIEMEVDFLALDKEDDVSKLRSLEYTGFYVNELQYVPKVLFDEMTSRAGRYPAMKDGGPSWYGVIADMNAPDEDHFIPMMTGEVEWPENMPEDERASLAWPRDWDYFMQPPGMLEVYGADGKTIEGYRDNPAAENAKWLPPGYYREQIKGKTRAWIKSRVLNKIALVIDGDPVWPWFRREVYVAKHVLEAVRGHDLYVVADFGRTPAIVIGQEVNNRAVVLEEMQTFNESAVTFAPKVKRHLEKKYPGFNVIFRGDPKGADKTQTDERTAFDIWAANGMPMKAAPVKQNLTQTRIQAVDSLGNTMYDGKPRLIISPNCRTLIIAMEGRYCFEKRKPGDMETKPEPTKNRYSHLADCLQYFAVSLGEGRSMLGLAPLSDLHGVQVMNKRRGAGRRVA
jgi:hypothetical protein